MLAEVQSTLAMMTSTGTSFILALEVLAALMLWPVKTLVLIPASLSIVLVHREMVSLETALWGLTKLINNCCSDPLRVVVC